MNTVADVSIFIIK